MSGWGHEEPKASLTWRTALGRTLPFNTYPLIDRFLGAIAREQADRFRPQADAGSQPYTQTGSASIRPTAPLRPKLFGPPQRARH
jgi:hypothetical protein